MTYFSRKHMLILRIQKSNIRIMHRYILLPFHFTKPQKRIISRARGGQNTGEMKTKTKQKQRNYHHILTSTGSGKRAVTSVQAVGWQNRKQPKGRGFPYDTSLPNSHYYLKSRRMGSWIQTYCIFISVRKY